MCWNLDEEKISRAGSCCLYMERGIGNRQKSTPDKVNCYVCQLATNMQILWLLIFNFSLLVNFNN